MIKKTFSSEVDDLMNTIIGKDTLITGTIDVKGALESRRHGEGEDHLF